MAKARLKLRKAASAVKKVSAAWAPGVRTQAPARKARAPRKIPGKDFQGNRSRGLPSHTHIPAKESVHSRVKGMYGHLAKKTNLKGEGGFRTAVANTLRRTRATSKAKGMKSVAKGSGFPTFARVGSGTSGLSRHLSPTLSYKGRGYAPVSAKANLAGKRATLLKLSRHGGKTRASVLGRTILK